MGGSCAARVRFWHKADIPLAPRNVCFRGKSGRGQNAPQCPFMFARQTLQGLIISSGGTYAANDSPAIWRCARAQPRASATARWSAIRRTDAPSGAGNHVINYRRMHVGDAIMMFGRGPGRECGDKNNCNGKRNFCLAEHFFISWLSFATYQSERTLSKD